MSIRDYDQVIQMIENKITLEKGELIKAVAVMLTLSKREASDILKFFDPEGRTLQSYIFERKIFRALEDFANGMSKDSIAEKYNYKDMSHFGEYVRKLCGGKTLLQHRKDGYVCPAPLYLKDLIDAADSEAETAYIKEMLGFVDEITKLKDELSRKKRKGSLSAMENHSTTGIKEQLISADKYNEFLKIEDLRALYGFDVETILRLYNISVSSESSLEDLCDQELEKKYYTDSRQTYRDETASLAYHVLYEGDSIQNWEYFIGDDEVDDRLPMYEDNLYSDVETLTNYDDVCNENLNAYDDIETDSEPTDEQLKAWIGIEPIEPGNTLA